MVEFQISDLIFVGLTNELLMAGRSLKLNGP